MHFSISKMDRQKVGNTAAPLPLYFLYVEIAEIPQFT